MLIYAQITPTSAVTYRRDPAGPVLAALLPVLDRAGRNCDAVAWLPDVTGAWWVAFGTTAILGEQNIARRTWEAEPGPLRLYSTPDLYERGGRRGACVLDWSDPVEVWDALQGAAEIEADSDALAKRLADAFKRATTPRLRIRVRAPGAPRPAVRRAA